MFDPFACYLQHQLTRRSATNINNKKQTHILASTGIEHDLDSPQEWETENSMEFQQQKCQVLKITSKMRVTASKYEIPNTIREEAFSAIYLGITVTNNLTWKEYIANIC